MKTQISRYSHRPGKRYSGVYEQQGRMITDADWNEMSEISKQRLDDRLTDLVGSGAPRTGGAGVVDDGGSIRIETGRLYADGLAGEVTADPSAPDAQLIAFDQQADFPLTQNWLQPSGSYVLYGDVWERTVTALEDPELIDPGLHGADTCTRTRTMAQVKWCPADTDPQDESQNPRRGNAELSLDLRSRQGGADPCDPCAEEVAIEGGVGNYLFRVEVHEVLGPPTAPTGLTLKWSSENAADVYAIGEEPAEFKQGDFVWELFYADSELRQGVHLQPTIPDERGLLQSPYPDVPTRELVRRWDGYIELEVDGSGDWTLVRGSDRGVTLALGDDASTSPGRVVLGSELAINLQSLSLTLGLDQRVFVTGDYWLATVREAAQQEGDSVLVQELPIGIEHRYVTLARVDAASGLEAASDAERRRMAFPPLTDLAATDVSFQASALCPQLDTAETVKQALELLCQAQAGGCRVPVGPGGTFETLDQAIDALLGAGETDIALCLTPGLQTLSAGLVLDNPDVRLDIEGVGGHGTSRVLVEGGAIDLNVSSLRLAAVDLRTAQPLPTMQLQGFESLTVEDCSISGELETQTSQALISVRSSGEMLMRANHIEGIERSGLNLLREIFDNAASTQLLVPLFDTVDRWAFDGEARARSSELAGKPLAEREDIADDLGDTRGGRFSGLTDLLDRPLRKLESLLRSPSPAATAFRSVLELLRAAGINEANGIALLIPDGWMAGRIEDNEIRGRISLYGLPDDQSDLTASEIDSLQASFTEPMLRGLGSTGQTLHVSRNRMGAVAVGSDILAQLRELISSGTEPVIDGIFGYLHLESNTIGNGRLQLVAYRHQIQGNAFHDVDHVSQRNRLAWILGYTATYVGNQGVGTLTDVFEDITNEDIRAANLNLLFTTSERP
ncbi:MAG: DUF6519 domain-containing protein [Acidobacteriota bacterium]